MSERESLREARGLTLLKQPKVAPSGRGWRELFKYVGGELLPADGQPAAAFAGIDSEGWPYTVGWSKSRRLYDSENRRAFDRAMTLTSTRYGAANGRWIGKNGVNVPW